MFKKIVEGVKYLHDRNIVHRDLKLMNIVVNDLNNPKIVDFGFARVGVEENFENGCGTPSYMAPELLMSTTTKRACKADIWALGIILFYLLTKTYPFRCSLDFIKLPMTTCYSKRSNKKGFVWTSFKTNPPGH